MIGLWLTLALAQPPAPPLVRWTASDRETTLDEVDEATTPPRLAREAQGQRHLEPVELSPHGFTDATSLDLTLSTRGGHLYYLRATVRHDDFIAHWTQGPWVGTDESVPVTLQVPAEVAATLGASTATLSVKALSMDRHGHVVGQQLVGRSSLTSREGRVERAPLVPDETVEAE